MPRVDGQIHIDAPVSRVHATILAIEDYPAWASGVRTAEVQARDPAGRPQRAKFSIDTPVGVVGYTLEYTHGASEVSWALAEGELLRTFDGRYFLRESDGGTDLECSIDLAVDLPIPGSMAKQAASNILERAMSSLRTRAEDESGTARIEHREGA